MGSHQGEEGNIQGAATDGMNSLEAVHRGAKNTKMPSKGAKERAWNELPRIRFQLCKEDRI